MTKAQVKAWAFVALHTLVVFGVGLGKMVAFAAKHGHVELFIQSRLVFRMAIVFLVVL